MASGDTRTQQYLDVAANGTRADLPTDTCCETRTQTLVREVAERIMDVEDEVERLENNPDVTDIVATYADLQAYPTGQLTDKDVVRVLQDETHDGDSTYYRWSTTTQTWTYIGESKQYSDFVGTDGTAGGQNGLVPAPVATDAGKFLNANGSWEEVQAGPTVVQTTGTSTTDVMSQNATTSMIYADPGNNTRVRIGDTASTQNAYDIAIGHGARGGGGGIAIGNGAGPTGSVIPSRGISIGDSAHANNQESGIAIGNSVATNGLSAVAIGAGANASASGAIALGAQASATVKGEMNIGVSDAPTYYGYNSSNYRLLTGLYDPQNAHDAATKGYVDTQIGNINTALQILLNGTGA